MGDGDQIRHSLIGEMINDNNGRGDGGGKRSQHLFFKSQHIAVSCVVPTAVEVMSHKMWS